MLTLVGLGLCDGKDITLRGKEAVDASDLVYLESYTSLLQCSHAELEQTLGKQITRLSRKNVETEIESILLDAKQKKIVVLVIGDVFGATTHADMYLRAKVHGLTVHVIHNASILNAVGAVGLELYRYGKTVSIPYWSKGYEPTSFLDGIKDNLDHELHTLCLLDIKADEGRFMSVQEGINHLQQAMCAKHPHLLPATMKIVGIARIGCPDQQIAYGTMETLLAIDFGKPPHALVIPGKLHHIEQEMLCNLSEGVTRQNLFKPNQDSLTMNVKTVLKTLIILLLFLFTLNSTLAFSGFPARDYPYNQYGYESTYYHGPWGEHLVYGAYGYFPNFNGYAPYGYRTYGYIYTVQDIRYGTTMHSGYRY